MSHLEYLDLSDSVKGYYMTVEVLSFSNNHNISQKWQVNQKAGVSAENAVFL